MAFERVASVKDVPEGEGRGFELNGRRVAVFNLGAGEVRALEDICSHAHAYLSEGEVDTDDESVECPRHGSTFELDSGRPTSLPATAPVQVFPVQMDGEDILIDVEGG